MQDKFKFKESQGILPREKLQKYGQDKLSEVELLSVLLGTGTKNMNVKELSEELLQKLYTYDSISDINLNEIMTIDGIGLAKGTTLLAALEIGKRMNGFYYQKDRNKIITPEEAADYFQNRISDRSKEHFLCLLLNTKLKKIGEYLISLGSLNTSIVHPREAFKEAVRRSAHAIIFCHNHPSGDCTPSKEDILLTQRLREAGSIIGIEVLDHIIIGDGKYLSLKEKGYME